MDFDSIVIGAGVVGLAVARALALSGRSVIVLEKNSRIGEETSSRNSEVIHAGIYYPKDSMKAKMCVEGKKLLYAYCRDRNIEHKNTGKLIVASSDDQVPALHDIMQKGLDNGVDDLRLVNQDELEELEPELKAVQAIMSPSTGIIDSHGLMLSLLGDLENAGSALCLRSPVEKIETIPGGFEVFVGGDEPCSVTAKEVINCGGLHARNVSLCFGSLDSSTVPPAYYSRGCYFTMSGPNPFKRLVYPIPDNEGLGIHLTIDLQGCARFGPDTEWVTDLDYTVDPQRSALFYKAIRTYFPRLEDGALQPGYSGIRPKVTGPFESAGDFVIQTDDEHGQEGFVALYGIESPGLTSCLAIANFILEKLECH